MTCFIAYSEEINKGGRCCCNCEHQVEIMSHPWNTMTGGRLKGPVTNVAGYGCGVMQNNQFVFFESKHSLCEMHSFKEHTCCIT